MAIRFVLDADLTAPLRAELIALWTDVTNAGGAIGFVPPVTRDDVRPTAAAAYAGVEAGHDRLLAGFVGDRLVAALFFTGNRFALKNHWCTLTRVMVHPDCQGRGYGAALLREAERVARELGWDALQVTVRGGLGLEGFYPKVGYREVGRRPRAIRVGPGDDRDEIIMWRALE